MFLDTRYVPDIFGRYCFVRFFLFCFANMAQDVVKIQIDDLELMVDPAPAENLIQNAQFRANYMRQVRELLKNSVQEGQEAQVQSLEGPGKNSQKDNTPELVWITKKPLERDITATHFFLDLRKELDSKFSDQKTDKNSLWDKISEKMNEAGFFVGEGTAGREKCRKKFSNLQASYLRYIDNRRQTGQGKLVKPPFFDILDEILRDKHKTIPPLLIDSLHVTNKDSDKSDVQKNKADKVESKMEESSIQEGTTIDDTFVNGENQEPTSSKYASVKKSVKPSKNNILEDFYLLEKNNTEDRRNEFKQLMEYLKDTSNKRHEEVMALISSSSAGTSGHKSKKRKRDKNYSSSSESE